MADDRLALPGLDGAAGLDAVDVAERAVVDAANLLEVVLRFLVEQAQALRREAGLDALRRLSAHAVLEIEPRRRAVVLQGVLRLLVQRVFLPHPPGVGRDHDRVDERAAALVDLVLRVDQVAAERGRHAAAEIGEEPDDGRRLVGRPVVPQHLVHAGHGPAPRPADARQDRDPVAPALHLLQHHADAGVVPLVGQHHLVAGPDVDGVPAPLQPLVLAIEHPQQLPGAVEMLHRIGAAQGASEVVPLLGHVAEIVLQPEEPLRRQFVAVADHHVRRHDGPAVADAIEQVLRLSAAIEHGDLVQAHVAVHGDVVVLGEVVLVGVAVEIDRKRVERLLIDLAQRVALVVEPDVHEPAARGHAILEDLGLAPLRLTKLVDLFDGVCQRLGDFGVRGDVGAGQIADVGAVLPEESLDQPKQRRDAVEDQRRPLLLLQRLAVLLGPLDAFQVLDGTLGFERPDPMRLPVACPDLELLVDRVHLVDGRGRPAHGVIAGEGRDREHGSGRAK